MSQMRFKEFLLQEENLFMPLDQGLETIKDNCRHFLSEIKSGERWLYRGMDKTPTDQIVIMDQRRERSPRDSSGGFNVFFNAGIEIAFDVPLIRSRSVFVTGNKSDAESYGKLYFVFPEGDFNYMWSPKVDDSYVKDDWLARVFSEELRKANPDFPISSSSLIQKIFESILHYSDGNISRAVMNLKTNDKLIEEMFGAETTIDQVEHALLKTFFPIYFQDQDLVEAIESQNEVMIYKSDGNIFVPSDLIKARIDSDKSLEGQSPEEYLSNFFWTNGA